MKITPARVRANRANSLKSTGPTDQGKKISSQNARRHGVLARNLVFKSQEDQAAFECLLNGLLKSWEPLGLKEEILVEEMAIDCWKLSILIHWTLNALQASHESVSAFIVKDLCGQSTSQTAGPAVEGANGIQMHWVAEYVLMKAARQITSSFAGTKQQTEFEAKLESAFHLALRYERTVKRDFYKAAEKLEHLQNARRGIDETKPS